MAAKFFLSVFALVQIAGNVGANPTAQAIEQPNHLLNLVELAQQLKLNSFVKAVKETGLHILLDHEGKSSKPHYICMYVLHTCSLKFFKPVICRSISLDKLVR